MAEHRTTRAERRPCRYEDEDRCREEWHMDDGIPYCDACGMFRWSVHRLLRGQARQRLTDLWMNRPRIALTAGFQISYDAVMIRLDVLHWNLLWSITRGSFSLVLGPFSIILVKTASGLAEMAGGEDGADYADEVFDELDRLRKRVAELEAAP